MTTLTIQTPRPLMTSNDQRAWTWPKVRQAKKAMALQVTHAARAAQIETQTDQIAVRVNWYPTDRRRRDADALGPFVKAMLDALVDIGVIADDSWTHVASVTTSIGTPDKTNPRITVTLVPARACWVCGENRPPPPACGPECHPTRKDQP